MDPLLRLKKRKNLISPEALYLMGILVGAVLTQIGGGIPIESIFASESSASVRLEFKPQIVQGKTPKNSSSPDNASEEVKTPNLPPSAIDPGIVHEPPTTLNPEAVITPPNIDPDMAVQPRTLPGYPDNLKGGTEKRDAGGMSGNRGSPLK